MPPNLSLRLRLSGLHVAAFLSYGILLPFFPVWLQAKAWDAAMIGVMVAIPIVTRIVATAPLLTLADRDFGPRRLLIASHWGQIIGYPMLMILDDTILIALVVTFLAVAHAAVVPGNDLVTMDAVRRQPRLHYGRIRVWGSIAFLVASIGTGYLVDAAGIWVVPLALGLVPCFGILATQLALPRNAQRTKATLSDGIAHKAYFSRLLWVAMIAAAFTQASHGAIYAFGSIHWRTMGFSDASIGYLWAIGVVAEILVFVIFSQAVGRSSAALGLLLVGSGAAAIRFAAMASEPGLTATFALQVLHGLSFGATHLGAMAALAALAPESVRGRAQGLLGSTIALGSAMATIVSGSIYRSAGPAVFGIMALLGAVGFILTLYAIRLLKVQPQRAGDGG